MATKKPTKVSKKVSKKTKPTEKILEEISNKLFNLIGTDAKATVVEDKENATFMVNVEAEEEAGLLIGNRGKTIYSLQTVLNLILKQRTGEWYRVVVNIGDWLEKEKERLEQLAQQTKDRAKETGESQVLYNLTPGQRRLVHLYLSEDKSVDTKSEGEGENRYLIVSPK
ncbi:hypothetical protein A2955_03730 [Candidatus Woesebacteria bacterium RIFCSPLOWO2_01_FULL_37_19]|uniref:R3H domain-containing protein n=2 Tax=Candidatus Woeseibacteriota TaxID=1752722 RepID=A0A1F8AXY4_9BACT|nr:MAG: hypothetical protein A2771_04130 [Candidatus Woesebacteria bacterium RIFCSPHIGHO2_01_FULL_38_26b]OGM56612.1 MAG: hypothetical protein A2955_03730 [Candidatus Woesebacteria bacterium RIFCSPLOWO2_01_FULL_37_19]